VSQPFALADLLVGLAWIGAGIAIWGRRRARRSAVLMVAVGVTWLLGDVDDTLALAHRGPLAHLLLAYPSGRLGSSAARAVAAATYVAAVAAAAWPGPLWTLGFAATLAIATLARFAATTGAVRRSRTAPLGVALAIGIALTVSALAHNGDTAAVYDLAVAVSALALARDLRRGQWSRGAIAGLVVDLGRRPSGGVVRERLARAVGDPSLTVAYLLEDGRAVDEHGRAIALPDHGADRAATTVQHDGRPLAVLVHDRAALGDATVLTEAASALSVAVANARLQADVRALGADIEASTRRLVDAGAAQRRRLRRELDARVEPQIDEAAQALHEAHADELAEQLRGVRDQLARFADGLDPVPLHEGGFAAALRALAERAGLPVSLSLSVDRCNADVEACAWFVCSEAIANALKHARATHLSIDVATRASVLRVEVADDGVGAADPSRGSGLRRLAERVRASGGMLTIDSRPGDGTRVIAELDVRGAA
jgi:signal transduction histidine kinase